MPSASTSSHIAGKRNVWIEIVPLILFPALTIACRSRMPAWLFMWALSFAIFAALKWMTWWNARSRVAHSAGRAFAYLVAWPGMDADSFLDAEKRPDKPSGREWAWAALKTSLGVGLVWIVARQIPEQQSLLRGWTGLFGLIFLLHFGSFHLIALFWQTIGIDAQPIMSKPVLSKTLSEFWGNAGILAFANWHMI